MGLEVLNTQAVILRTQDGTLHLSDDSAPAIGKWIPFAREDLRWRGDGDWTLTEDHGCIVAIVPAEAFPIFRQPKINRTRNVTGGGESDIPTPEERFAAQP